MSHLALLLAVSASAAVVDEVPLGVDGPDDLERARAMLASRA